MTALSVPTVSASGYAVNHSTAGRLFGGISLRPAVGGTGAGLTGWDGAVEPAASVADAELGLHLPAHADLIRAGDVGQSRCSSQPHRLLPARERCLHRQHAEGTLATWCRQFHRRCSGDTGAGVIDGEGARRRRRHRTYLYIPYIHSIYIYLFNKININATLMCGVWHIK